MSSEGFSQSGAQSGAEGFDWDSSPDLTAVSDEDLRSNLEKLAQEEQDVSYRRRVIQGRIDLIRVELTRRNSLSLSPEDLARVLMGQDRQENPGAGKEGANS